MEENMQAWQDALEVAIKIIEEGKSLAKVAKTILEKSDLVTKVGAYLRTIADISIGRTGAKSATENAVHTNKLIVEKENNKFNATEIKEVTLKSNIKNLYHRRDGRWEYKKRRNGELIRFTVSTKEQAIEKLKEIKSIARKKVDTVSTFDAWIDKWLKLYKQENLTEGSLKRYKQLINKHIKPYFKDTPIKKITVEKAQQFINQVPTERNQEYAYTTIKQILKYAFINKKINENIAEMLVKPRRKTRTIKTALSLNEQIAFIKVLKTYEADVQMFMLFSLVLGSRRSETLAFKFEDINKSKNTIHIKGTKTIGSDRRVKISNEMISLLENNKRVADNEPYFKYVLDNYSKKAKDI